MKKLVLSLALVSFGTFAMAQQKKVAPMNPEAHQQKMEQRKAEHMAKMQKELNLTPAQAAQIKAVNERYKDIHEQNRAQMKAVREQRFAENKKIQQQRDNELRQILTPEQYAKWEANKQENMAKKKMRMKHFGNKIHGARKMRPEKAQK